MTHEDKTNKNHRVQHNHQHINVRRPLPDVVDVAALVIDVNRAALTNIGEQDFKCVVRFPYSTGKPCIDQ
eukprot:9700559-Prorocentrum_lima.AAC.1